MKISKAMTRLLHGCKEFETSARCLPACAADHRVTRSAMRRGLIAFNPWAEIGGGYCITPAGRAALSN